MPTHTSDPQPDDTRPAFIGLRSIGITPDHTGKVREIIDLGDELLIVTTDRISAFDQVMPTGVPGKGVLLNRLTSFWFRGFAQRLPTHYLGAASHLLPPELSAHAGLLAERSMRVRKAERVAAECVVRGWLAGSGYADYQETGSICGVRLPAGLHRFDRLPEPIFTPTTKADQGHDQPLSFEELTGLLGGDVAGELRRLSLAVYHAAAAYAERRGVVIADTKLEFGWLDGRLALIDELFTPDSSRFWPLESTGQGRRPISLDKQVLRDYLLASGWDRQSPPPALPAGIVASTRRGYLEAVERLTGGATQPDWTGIPFDDALAASEGRS